MSVSAKYDKIGQGYDQSRKPDPFILASLCELLNPVEHGKYLDVACGSGNYTRIVSKTGNWIGIDESSFMLRNATKKKGSIGWTQADVEGLPFANSTFDGLLCTLAIHHFPSLENAFRELYRVLNKGTFVLFTSTSEQMEGYWLNEYFPKAMKASIEQMPSMIEIKDTLNQTGFADYSERPYFVADDLKDRFLYSGKHAPSLYLKESFRNGISTFTALADESEIRSGCKRIEEDIENNKINEVIESYSNDLGDYLFVTVRKTTR